MQKSAFGDYYSVDEETGKEKYIGLNKELEEHSQIVKIEGNWKIDEELFLFSKMKKTYPIPKTNQRLKKRVGDELVQDDFQHEQCLVIQQKGKQILFSGCAHQGILNMMDTYVELFGTQPDVAISGFHLMRKNKYPREDVRTIIDTAQRLVKYDTQFYTCHCTGEKPYEVMKKIMGYQLKAIHSGDEIPIGSGKKRGIKAAPWSKVVAGAALLCLTLSVIRKGKK
jgi:7,8-dihydropterin-6-yl-methyl-4-(beta-D-ribofuranosyl)aminobenzene 5'-phosphate synthase